MKYFFDTEFAETGDQNDPTIDLISIGIVCEDSRTYYAESSSFDHENCDDWVMENVVDKLLTNTQEDFKQKKNSVIAEEIQDFIAAPHSLVRGEARPEFWAYYASYDWVVFCWLFGKMIHLPEGYPMHPMDLQQWWKQLGQPDIKPPTPSHEHNALADALWNQQLWHALMAEQNDRYAR